MVSDYLLLLFPLPPLVSYSSFPISCSCLFVLTIFLVTYIWIKCLLLFAGWYLFSEIWEGVHWTKAKSRDAHSFYLGTSPLLILTTLLARDESPILYRVFSNVVEPRSRSVGLWFIPVIQSLSG